MEFSDRVSCWWNLIKPGQWSVLLLGHAFILDSWTKYHSNPLPAHTRVWKIIFLDQAIEDLEHGLESILTDSIKTLECDASFDNPDVISSSVSLGFLYSVSATSDNSKL